MKIYEFVSKGPINDIPVLVQVMAWRRPGDKPLSEPMMACFDDAYMRHSASMSYTDSITLIQLSSHFNITR